MSKGIKTTILISAAILLALLAGTVFLFQRLGQASPSPVGTFAESQYKAAAALHTQLKTENAAYAEANRLRLKGNYADAIVKYKEALQEITDPGQAAEASFWLASSDAATGDYAEAVSIYKSLAAASTTLSNMTRAYAIQDLALMHYRYNDPVITEEIFKDEPYKALRIPNILPRSYRNVFDYAASLYPLALSELYSADWYASRLATGTTTSPYTDIIVGKLQLAQKDLDIIGKDPTQRNTYLISLERRAVVLGKLKRAGKNSFPDPEAAFKNLLALYARYHLSADGTTRLQYAYYLSHVYGENRAAEIKDLLVPIVQNPSARGVSLVSFLKHERANTLGAKANLVLLASLDPDFKTLLKSLGWTESDFSAKAK